MKKTALAVFDIDGTLTDSVAVHQEAFEAALRSFRFPSLRTDWGSYTHHTDSGIFAEAWADAGFEGTADLALLEARFAPLFEAAGARRPIAPIAGAEALLAGLVDTRWAVAFATGSLEGPARAKLSVVGGTGVLVTASSFASREEIVSEAINRARAAHGLGADAPVLSVGDGLWDLEAARNLGLGFLGIGTGAKAEALNAAAPGAVVVDDLTAGLAALERALDAPVPRA